RRVHVDRPRDGPHDCARGGRARARAAPHRRQHDDPALRRLRDLDHGGHLRGAARLMRRAVAILAVGWLAACATRPSARDEPCELGQVVGGQAEPEAAEKVPLPRKRAWEAARGGEVAARPFVAARTVGWPRVRVARDLPADDRAFLNRVARDTWRGLAAFTDREHALPVDHVRLSTTSLARADARVGDYTNVTSVG